MVVADPRQQRVRLLDLGGVHARRRRLVDQRLHALAHRLPVLDRGAHLREHAAQRLGELLEPVRLAVDLDVHVGLVADDRVHEHVDAGLAAAELHAHRVHEERHVVGDDVDRRVRRLPAVLLERRVVDAHQRVARVALAPEGPVRQRGAVEVDRLAAAQVLGRRAAVVRADERLGLRDLSGATRSRTRSQTDSMSSDSTSCVPVDMRRTLRLGSRQVNAPRARGHGLVTRAGVRPPPGASRAGCDPAAS